jgi:hypothetical protein
MSRYLITKPGKIFSCGDEGDTKAVVALLGLMLRPKSNNGNGYFLGKKCKNFLVKVYRHNL